MIELLSSSSISVTEPTFCPTLTSGVIYVQGHGAITQYAASGPNTQVTSTGHDLVNGEIITIYLSTNYNGVWTVSNVAVNTFDIATAFVGDDAVGAWWRSDAGIPVPELISGPIDVGADLYEAIVKKGSRSFAETYRVTIDGDDYTTAIKGSFGFNKREGSGGTTINIKLDGSVYSYLDHAAADMGKVVTIDCIYRGSTEGAYYEVPLWTGYVQSVETSYADGVEDTLLCVMDQMGVWDLEKRLTVNFTLDATPYNCVVYGEQDECEVEEWHLGDWNWLCTLEAGFAGLAGESLTVSVDEVDTVLVYGVDIAIGGTATITAANTAAAITAIVGVSATSDKEVVTVVPDVGTVYLTMTTSAPDTELTLTAPVGGTVSTTEVYVSAGIVMIDRRGIGGFMNPGGSYEDFWPFEGSCPPMTGEIAQITIPAQIVDLVAAGCTMTGVDCPGVKTIYVPADSTGTVLAIDGTCPSNGIALASVTLGYEGQPLTNAVIHDERVINVWPDRRTRGEMIKLAMERVGIPTVNMRVPSINDDFGLSNPISVIDKPFSQWANEWCAPSAWSFGCGSNGRPKVRSALIKRSPVNPTWEYDQNAISTFRIGSPQKGEASADVTVRGIRITNNGLTMRTVESINEVYTEQQEAAEDDGSPTGCCLGGHLVQYGGTEKKRQLTSRIVTRTTYYGNSVVLEDIDQYQLLNPPNLRNVDARLHWTSQYYGVNNLYAKPLLTLTNKQRTAHVYQNRLRIGHVYIERELYNPTRDGALFEAENPYGGVGFGGIPWAQWHRANSPGYIRGQYENPTAPPTFYYLYGDTCWKYFEPQLTIVNVIENVLTVNSAARIISEHETCYSLASPAMSWSGWGYPGQGPDANRNEQPFSSTKIGRLAYAKSETSDTLYKSGETITTYEKVSAKQIRVCRSSTSWVEEEGGRGGTKDGQRVAMSTGRYSKSGVANAAVLGPETVEIKEGDLPMADSLEDDIERRPVAFRAYSTTIAALLGCERVIDEEVPYVETLEQAKRVAVNKLGRSVAPQVQFAAPFNPLLDIHDTVRLTVNTRQDLAGGGAGKRTYTLDVLVTGINVNINVDPKAATTMSVTGLVDYNDMRPTLATRT